jgi:hypothetical protein
MDVTTALLCDFAQVRDGLLFVSSGGITRLWRNDLPAPMGVCLAIVIELDQVESQRPHELHVVVMGEDGGKAAEIKGGFTAGGHDLDVTERIHLPLTFDLRAIGLERYGRYDLKIYVDGNHHRDLGLKVGPRPTPDGA